MPSATTIVQTVSAALASAGVVAGAAKYTGVWALFVSQVSRAISTGQPADIEAAAGVARSAGPAAGVALNNLQRRLSGQQAATVASVRRRASV